MNSCLNCVHAKWAGETGVCGWKLGTIILPQAWYFINGQPRPYGGQIKHEKPYTNCPCWASGKEEKMEKRMPQTAAAPSPVIKPEVQKPAELNSIPELTEKPKAEGKRPGWGKTEVTLDGKTMTYDSPTAAANALGLKIVGAKNMEHVFTRAGYKVDTERGNYFRVTK